MKKFSCLIAFALGLFCALPALATPVNVAPSGTATQSSDGTWGWTAGAWLANDGNTNQSYYGGQSVAHTLLDYMPWWEVDLHQSYGINQIVIWNRSDGGADSLSNFVVTIANSQHQAVWQQLFYGSGGFPYPTMTIDFANAVDGQYVKIQRQVTGYLMLAEVQVMSNGLSADGAAPEPAPLALLLLGLAAFAARKRRIG